MVPVHAGGHHIKGKTTEMTDSIDITDQTDTTVHTKVFNPVADASLAASHSVQQDHSESTRNNQEQSNTHSQGTVGIQDAELQDTLTTQPMEQYGTKSGHAKMQNHHSVGYKREHSPVLSSQTSPVHVLDDTGVCTAACCLVETEQDLVVDGDTSQGQEERQPKKRVRLETMEVLGREGNGLPTSTEAQEQPNIPQPTEQDTSTSVPNQGLEVTAAPPPATTRSVPLTPTRPTSLPVSSLLHAIPPAAAIPHTVQGGDAILFQNSEEERTPNGGIGEFVGQSLHSPLRNNGEMVTPEKRLTPQNTVFGRRLPLNLHVYGNNTHYYAFSRRHADTIRRQNSEPTGELYGLDRRHYDNNGRMIVDEEDSLTASL